MGTMLLKLLAPNFAALPNFNQQGCQILTLLQHQLMQRNIDFNDDDDDDDDQENVAVKESSDCDDDDVAVDEPY